LNETVNPIDLGRAKTAIALQPYRIEPELGDPVITFDVNVGRLIAVTGPEE
jgi:hypothetical protein